MMRDEISFKKVEPSWKVKPNIFPHDISLRIRSREREKRFPVFVSVLGLASWIGRYFWTKRIRSNYIFAGVCYRVRMQQRRGTGNNILSVGKLDASAGAKIWYRRDNITKKNWQSIDQNWQKFFFYPNVAIFLQIKIILFPICQFVRKCFPDYFILRKKEKNIGIRLKSCGNRFLFLALIIVGFN